MEHVPCFSHSCFLCKTEKTSGSGRQTDQLVNLVTDEQLTKMAYQCQTYQRVGGWVGGWLVGLGGWMDGWMDGRRKGKEKERKEGRKEERKKERKKERGMNE